VYNIWLSRFTAAIVTIPMTIHRTTFRRWQLLLVLVAATAAACWPDVASEKLLQQQLTTILHDRRLQGAVVGVEVRRWPEGQVLYALKPRRALVPASNMKLLVTAAALELLGARYRYSTTIWAWPPPEGTELPGDVILEGSSDPTATAAIYDELARRLRRMGIRRIGGRVLACGCVLATESDPAVSARAFHTALGNAGITAAGMPQAGRLPALAFPVTTHKSRPLGDIIKRINKPSNNRLAEALLASLASRFGDRGEHYDFLVHIYQDLGLDCSGVHVADGAGLSHDNLLTPHFIVSLLEHIRAQPDVFAVFLRSLPVAGTDGTLRDRLRGTAAQGRVHAKTGTLTGISALSGYVRGTEGRGLTFSILINNYSCSTQTARHLLDRAALALARFVD